MKIKIGNSNSNISERDKIGILYTVDELEEHIERGEMFMHRSGNNPAEQQVWKDRLATYYNLLHQHTDYHPKKSKRVLETV